MRLCSAVAKSRGSLQLAASAQGTKVVVTREKGKNGKLMKALQHHGIGSIELPLIEHADGPELRLLPKVLATEAFEWVTITSPEAASVFIKGWKGAGCPKVRVAVVGAATGEVLQQAGVSVDYTPSKAIGKTLGAEVPKIEGGNRRVLYPASLHASSDLQDSLSASGFTVVRLNTYDTVLVTEVEPALLLQAKAAPIITFGSPSTVKAWVALVGKEVAAQQLAVCIGSTSARACQSQGLTRIYHPEAPGVEGWVEQVLLACRENGLQAAVPT